jgi:CheY-like chemotaxis protein
MARSAGLEPRCASSASDIAAAAAGSYDVVVVDLHLGEVDVLDVLSRLADASPGCDLVLMTGSAVSSTGIAAGWARTLGLHVVAELAKPVRIPELRSLLAGLAAETSAAS